MSKDELSRTPVKPPTTKKKIKPEAYNTAVSFTITSMEGC